MSEGATSSLPTTMGQSDMQRFKQKTARIVYVRVRGEERGEL